MSHFSLQYWSRSKYRVYEISAFIFAIIFSYIILTYYQNYLFKWDEKDYFNAAIYIKTHGFLSKEPVSYIRTYGYPAFLAIATSIINTINIWHLNINPRTSVYFSQLIIYLLTAVILRNWLKRYSGYPAVGSVVFIIFCLNIFNLAYLPFCLTETLSLCMVIVTVILLMETIGNYSQLRKSLGLYLLAGLALGFTVEIRPANIYFLLIFIPFFVYDLWHEKFRTWIRSLVFLAGVAIALFPQFYINFKYYALFSPLVASNLENLQKTFGINLIKYTTNLVPNFNAGLHYYNPFIKNLPSTDIYQTNFYNLHPKIWFITSLLHIFNTFDQDFLVPYVKYLTPWYIYPASLLSLTFAGLGIFGFLLTVKRNFFPMQTRFAPDIPEFKKPLLLLLLVVLICNILLYSQTAVEARFGLVLLTLCSFFVPIAFLRIFSYPKKLRLIAIGIFCSYLIAGSLLHYWVQLQAPTIQAYKVLMKT